MVEKTNNPFEALYDENKTANAGKAQAIQNEAKETKVVKKEEPKERDTSVLYRLNKKFYKEIQMFAKIKGESVNTILELAVISYLNKKENVDDYNLAKSLAEKIKK